ncbi:MAG: hypothetical protein KDC43_14325 [Saprospiraceae bacterium]|nr:hypothetical protein [Saprospiraceae bacterium]MCB0625048.1 hypothetical protein [Saprospiraceae bacterium]MCB0677483.1 hypothetical protein [Saprospiraceae bacterium]MCB0682264.1 hypothetical protein [Saprospiraceae bacterium]
MNRLLLLGLALLFSIAGMGQEFIYGTFKDTRVINSHSVETLPKRKLDIRISHRFGDLLGDAGGWRTFYGLENATDILIGGEYGITDQLTAGLSRSKGAGDLRQLVNGLVKYRLVRQSVERSALTITAVVTTSFSTMEKDPTSEGLNSFPEFAHRLVYSGHILAGSKISKDFSLQLGAGYTHRNLVKDLEINGIFTVNLASRIQITKVLGLLLDATVPLNGQQSPFLESEPGFQNFYPMVGIGFEFDTGGHVFQVNLTNSTGIVETDYIPYTNSNWFDGQFRLGFTISRTFNL